MKVSIKTGDTVLVNSGKDSGKKGKVLEVKETKKGVRVIVEGANIMTKTKKARTAQDKSEIIKTEAAMDISNVNVICPTCGKPTRVKHAIVDGKKVRVCSCGAVLDKKYAKDTKAKKVAEAEPKTEKTEKTEKKSKTTKKAVDEKATKTAETRKPTTSRASQRGV